MMSSREYSEWLQEYELPAEEAEHEARKLRVEQTVERGLGGDTQ